MKKVIALLLALICVFSFASCSKLDSYDNEVNPGEFYRSLSAAINTEDLDEYFRRNFVAKESISEEKTSVITYLGGNEVEDEETSSSEMVIKYDNDNGKTQITAEVESKEKSDYGEYSVTRESDTIYVQEGDDLLSFNPTEKTYEKDSNKKNGAYNKATSALEDSIETALGYYIDLDIATDKDYDFSKLDTNDMKSDRKYYVDGNTFTVVYHKESTTNSSEGILDDLINPQGFKSRTSATTIVVQIIVDDDCLEFISEKTTTITTVYDKYTEVETETENEYVEVEFKGSVSISTPKKDDYTDVTGSGIFW